MLFTGSAIYATQAKASSVTLYDLGEEVLQDGDGKTVSYRVQGLLGVPDRKNAPVVVLVHGAHPIETASEDRYDTGFEYLVRDLSKQGNLVLSVNVGINYSFEAGEPTGNERTMQILTQHLSLLQQAVNGDQKLFGRDLTDAGDLQKMILMGHSRAGLDVIEWASQVPEGMAVSGIVSVAPSVYKTLDTPIPDVPVGILLPQMDGDVILLDGNDIYEWIVRQPQYTSTSELIYLKNANHGAFNTELTQPDLNHQAGELAKLMPPEKQREFLTRYLTDFVSRVVAQKQPVFAACSSLESKAYGADVLLRVHSGLETRLYEASNKAALVGTAGTSSTQRIAHYIPAQNTVEYFRMPGAAAFDGYALQQLQWTEPNGKISIPVAGPLESSRFLDIDMAVDSTDVRNADGQRIKITLMDENANRFTYEMDSKEPALLWQEGELLEEKGWEGESIFTYSTFTPLVTLRMDLSQATGVDLRRISEVELAFESAGGSIMLRGISGV